MAKDRRKSQQIRARRAARRRAKKKDSKKTRQVHDPLLDRAGTWPLLECLINANWQDTKEISQVVVARKAPAGDVAVGTFLVDLACLGVKDAMAGMFPSENAYYSDFRSHMMQSQPLEECDLDLAAKVIDEGIKYARSLGFGPHPDARKAFKVLGQAHPESCGETVPLGGDDGKPFFMAGPHDNVGRIMQTLNRNVGEGNYHFLAPIDEDELFFDDEEDLDDDMPYYDDEEDDDDEDEEDEEDEEEER